jgi:hypothetical protein
MKRYIMVGMVLGLLFLVCYVSGAPLAQEEELQYSWGRVSSLSSNQIMVKEYDYESDEEVDVTYAIDRGVKIENVNSLEEIAIGDSVGIDFLVRNNERVAKVIIVEKSSYEEEEEYTPEETYEEEPEYFPEEIE